jgi:nucleoside phosphorylase
MRPMARHTDINPSTTKSTGTTALPPVDWGSVAAVPPTPVNIGPRADDDPLPAADIVIVTWTTAEWSALDHVFLNSATPRSASDWQWKQAWRQYSRGASAYQADPQAGNLWGSFQLVRIDDLSGRPWRVLLFKSSAHLAHPPYIAGLRAMVRAILADTGADRIYSLGTAGGATAAERLGDAVITNSALLSLQQPSNTTDADNGAMTRCPTWFPATTLLGRIEERLLYRMSAVVTREALERLFAELQQKHPDDPGIGQVTLDDLLNDALRPEDLDAPRARAKKDVALLTTDFYYIASGSGASAYSVLEMDDAVIGREAERGGVRYCSVRNVSDPIVPRRAASGHAISEAVRSDWSGLIYAAYGMHTSHNGALAAWATIAGDGGAGYTPPRSSEPARGDDPLEVKLVPAVQRCGSCVFFWPEDRRQQPYGPFTAFDFDLDAPYAATAAPGSGPSRWVIARTRPPSFPNGEVAAGCRKAPIMTIGINPNLTAFFPGQAGASWCYPSFTSEGGTDASAKAAWYYRYRSVYQERLDLAFARRFVLPDGRVLAPRSGRVTGAQRASDAPGYDLTVRYDGDAADTKISLPGQLGDFPYVVLCDASPPHDTFSAGDVIAGKMAVPAGIQVEVQQQQQTYYTQFVPVLRRLEDAIRKSGYPSAALRIGEDVSQLDMVACASPHWSPAYLGGDQAGVDRIVAACVSRNAWAMKQIVQSRPAVIYVVGYASWKMFDGAFGAHVRRSTPLSAAPADFDFTLLRETTDPRAPARLVLEVTVAGHRYAHTARLVITPHFSYSENFLPQYRMSQAEWVTFQREQAACAAYLTADHGFHVKNPGPQQATAYVAVELSADPAPAAAAIAELSRLFPAAAEALRPCFYDAHAMMASTLDDLRTQGVITWDPAVDGGRGALGRTEGSCQFCVNQRWQLPLGCAYGKDKDSPPPPGFLEEVAERIVATGRPHRDE